MEFYLKMIRLTWQPNFGTWKNTLRKPIDTAYEHHGESLKNTPGIMWSTSMKTTSLVWSLENTQHSIVSSAFTHPNGRRLLMPESCPIPYRNICQRDHDLAAFVAAWIIEDKSKARLLQ